MTKLVLFGNPELRQQLGPKLEEDAGEPTLLVIELTGIELPDDFQVVPNLPPLDVNFGAMEKAIDRFKKLASDFEDAVDDVRRSARRTRELMTNARDSRWPAKGAAS